MSEAEKAPEEKQETPVKRSLLCDFCKELPFYSPMTNEEMKKAASLLFIMKMDETGSEHLKICFDCWHFILDTYDQYDMFITRRTINCQRIVIEDEDACFLCTSTMSLTTYFVDDHCLEVFCNMNFCLPKDSIDNAIRVCIACELMISFLQRLYLITVYKRSLCGFGGCINCRSRHLE